MPQPIFNPRGGMCSRNNSHLGNHFSYQSQRSVRPLSLPTRDYKERKKGNREKTVSLQKIQYGSVSRNEGNLQSDSKKMNSANAFHLLGFWQECQALSAATVPSPSGPVAVRTAIVPVTPHMTHRCPPSPIP